jgi:hypothetical protein
VVIRHIADLIQCDGNQKCPERVPVGQIEVASTQPLEDTSPHRLEYVLLILEHPDPRAELSARQSKKAWKVTLPDPQRRFIT